MSVKLLLYLMKLVIFYNEKENILHFLTLMFLLLIWFLISKLFCFLKGSVLLLFLIFFWLGRINFKTHKYIRNKKKDISFSIFSLPLKPCLFFWHNYYYSIICFKDFRA